MITNPLIMYNTDIPQSKIDAENYLSARGLPFNVVGINFTSNGSFEPDTAQLSDGTLTIQAGTFIWNGSAVTQYDGYTLASFLGFAGATATTLDALLMSTYTPLRFYDGSLHYPLVAHLAIMVWVDNHSYVAVMPNGRLGCPAGYGSGINPIFDFTVEMTPRGGGTILDQVLTNALAAETRCNFREPHVLSSTGGPYVAGGPPGFNAAYWPTLMAAAQDNYTNITYDLCSSAYPCGTGDGDDFLNGSVVPPLPIFGLCCPFNANGQAGAYQGDQNAPGAHVYSNNYLVRPGGWSTHWYSWQWFWAMDFLYNGGSAALLTVQEPTEIGIRDPKQFLVAMMEKGLSMAECLDITVSPAADSYNSMIYFDRQTIVGDPLYRPYATRAQLPAAAYPPGLLVQF